MTPDPGSPADWLRFARSDLAMARRPHEGDILVESLCFHAQQAVEKSLKAVLLAHAIAFPHTHNLAILLALLPATPVPPRVAASAALTDYAVTVRYPGIYEDISDEEYQEAIQIAETVLAWASAIVGPDRPV